MESSPPTDAERQTRVRRRPVVAVPESGERVVARHGGDLWVDSGPGESAAFWWTLPATGETGE